MRAVLRRLALFVLALLLGAAVATEQAPGAGKAVANKKDLKYIACDVCEHTISFVVGRLGTLSSGRFATYDEVDRLFEESRDIGRTESWIRLLDIQEQATRTL